MIKGDTLLEESVRSVIRDNLSSIVLEKIERRLAERYNMGLPHSLNEYHKLDIVLREYFGAGAEKLEKRIIERMHAMEKTTN